MSEKPSISSSEKIEKAKKYDRQLRLWDDHGQAALESCHICLINASAVGSETLKSLVLAGIGGITIIDDSKVTYQDLGNNFFVDNKSIGSFRGEIVLHNLLELNPDVRGTFVDQDVEEILLHEPEMFTSFSVVISAANMRESILLLLSKTLWEAKIPLLVACSYGMIGYIRLQVEEHTIVESHPDSALPDLRLDRPFPSLIKFVESLNFEEMSDREHSHVPYALILLYYLNIWKEKNGGEAPKSYHEKKAFKELIRKGMRQRENLEPEENFQEAVKAVNVAVGSSKLPSTVIAILREVSLPSPTTKPFWIMAKALEEFILSVGQGMLPVAGVIPDMTADSDKYIKLQNLYKEQANVDAKWVYRRIHHICQHLGPRKDLITESDVKNFCKNAQFLRVIRGKSIADEYRFPPKINIGKHLENRESSLAWYVMLRAVAQFHSEFRAYPGYFKDQVETDIVRLKVFVNRLLSDWGCGLSIKGIKDDFIHEICRYGAAEVHSVAAYVGGCAAHEVIKIVTGQYVPINNTHIYNAITGTSETFEI